MPHVTPRLAASLLVGLALALAPGAALADDTTQKEARALGKAGLTLYDRGDYAGALENFRRAYTMYSAPTLGIYTARSLAKLGRLLEARDVYARVVATPVERGAEEAFRRAVADAKREAEDVAARIPRLTIKVSGAEGAATVTLDGRPVDDPKEVMVDPGEHRVEAASGDHSGRATVAVREGQRVVVEVPVAAAPAAAAAPPIAAGADTGPTSSSPLRTVGWIALGAGAAGLAAGGVMGIVALGKKGALDESCAKPNSCPATAESDVDSYNGLRTGSAIAFWAGAGLAAAGVVLVIAAPSSTTARSSAWIGAGPGTVHLGARFR